MIPVLLVFPSVHWVLRAEKVMVEARLPHRMVTLPREVSSDCGMGIEIESEFLEPAREAMKNARIDDYRIVTRAVK